MNRQLVILPFLILFIHISGSCQAQTTKDFKKTKFKSGKDYKELLSGKWKFEELQDKNGEKVDKLYHPEWEGIIENPYETINRPDVEYKKSGTYNMVFTEKNTDYGLWQLDASNRIIIHKLIIDPNTEVGKDLIKRKLAYKGTDGVYYEDIEKQIFHLSSDILVILETTGHFRVSSKVK